MAWCDEVVGNKNKIFWLVENANNALILVDYRQKFLQSGAAVLEISIIQPHQF